MCMLASGLINTVGGRGLPTRVCSGVSSGIPPSLVKAWDKPAGGGLGPDASARKLHAPDLLTSSEVRCRRSAGRRGA